MTRRNNSIDCHVFNGNYWLYGKYGLARRTGEQVFSFLKWHTEEDFHTEVAKIAKGHSNSSVSGRLVWMDDRRAWHGKPKKIFTQRSQRSQRGTPIHRLAGRLVWWAIDALGPATEEDFHTEVAKIAKAGRGYAQLQKLPIDSPLHSREPPHATSQATNAAN
jgi:hypothetical protein